jgi:hypothetical protein
MKDRKKKNEEKRLDDRWDRKYDQVVRGYHGRWMHGVRLEQHMQDVLNFHRNPPTVDDLLGFQ